MSDVKSALNLCDWRGSVTLYPGAMQTLPSAEYDDLTWPELCEVLAPQAGPQVLPDKHRAPYFTPGLLQDAPLVGRTLEKARREGLPLVGKQRSGAHVTTATLIPFDHDRLTAKQGKRISQGLKAAGISFVAHTSWSIGMVRKPGIRARFVIPVDRALGCAEYTAAWCGANTRFFEGTADRTGARLYQQQGIWAIGPDRVQLARRWGASAGVASAEALIALGAIGGQATKKRDVQAVLGASVGMDATPLSMVQLAAAMKVLDPGEYEDWSRAISLVVAMSRARGADVAGLKRLVQDFSDRADESRRAGNDRAQYDPIARFDTWTPSITPAMAVATLFATARDRATAIYKTAQATGDWRSAGAAWRYLCAYHPKRWGELRATLEQA